MKTTNNPRIMCLAFALSCTALGCSSGGGAEDTSTGDSTSATTSATTGTTSTPTTDLTSGSTDITTGSTSTPTTDATTGEPATSSTSTTEATTTTTTGSTGGDDTSTTATSTGGVEPTMSFFVSSTGSMTGDLGGLAGADAIFGVPDVSPPALARARADLDRTGIAFEENLATDPDHSLTAWMKQLEGKDPGDKDL